MKLNKGEEAKRREGELAKLRRTEEEQKKETEKQKMPACANCGDKGHTEASCLSPPKPNSPPRR